VILASLLLLAAASPIPPPETAEQQIVVIGEKLKRWTGSAQQKDGQWVCRTKRSTGDVEIDRIGCDAMNSCLNLMEPERLEIWKDKDKKRRKLLYAAFYKDKLTPCVAERRSDGIAALAAQRAGL
jgi:hypothetical protein